MTKVLSPIDLRYIDGDKWMLISDFTYYSDVLGAERTVPAGFITDFNSIPFGLWNLFPPTKYGEAAVAHDELYVNNGVDRETADKVHREFVKWKNDQLEAAGEEPKRWKEAAMYWGLRAGGWKPWGKYRKKDKKS